MRITFVSPYPDRTGGQRVIAIYADQLQKRGHHVEVITPGRVRISAKETLLSLIRNKSWPRYTPVTSHFDDIALRPKILNAPRPVLSEDVPDADIVIATWWETAEWVMNFPESKGKKVYFIQHHEVFDYLPVERCKRTYKLPFHQIVVADWLAKVMQHSYGRTGVYTVPNAVDPTLFFAPPRHKHKTPCIGFIYSLNPTKGCDIAIRACEQALKRLPELRFVSFGHSKVSVRLPLPNNAVHHVNPIQSNIRDLYSSCTAWLFSSRTEGFGLPILEAMACRTPVIGTPVGAAPELISKGGGYLVRMENSEDMADAIVRLCQLPDEQWLDLSNKAYETATSSSWTHSTNLFERALQHIHRSDAIALN